jgi:hypothetical protein
MATERNVSVVMATTAECKTTFTCRKHNILKLDPSEP